MPSLEEILISTMTARPPAANMPAEMAPPEIPFQPPSGDASQLTGTPPKPKEPAFLRRLLFDFVGSLGQNLKSGAFQSATARGIQAGRRRGGGAGDAFAESFGAIGEEAESRKQLEMQQGMQKIQALATMASIARQEEIMKQNQLRLQTTLAGHGLEVDDQGEIKPLPPGKLPPLIQSKIDEAASRNQERTQRQDYRGSLLKLREADQEFKKLQLQGSAEQREIARQNLGVRRLEYQLKVQRFGLDVERLGRLSPGQEDKIAEFMDVAGDFEQAQVALVDAKSLIGGIEGRGRAAVLLSGGEVDQKYAEFALQIAQLKNKLLTIRTGKAQTDAEFRRVAQELPIVDVLRHDSPQNIEIKLKSGLADVKRLINNYVDVGTQGAAAVKDYTDADLQTALVQAGGDVNKAKEILAKRKR